MIQGLLNWYSFCLNTLQKTFFYSLKPTPKPITVLIWRDAHLGDGLLTLPSLVRIRENFPHAHLILLSHNGGIPGIHLKDYLEDGWIDEVWDRSSWGHFKLVKEIRKRKISHLLALFPYSASLKWNVFSVLLVKLAGVKYARGWKKESTFLFKKWWVHSAFNPEMKRLELILDHLGFHPLEKKSYLPIQRRENNNGGKANLLILAPFTKGVANFWGEENWMKLGEKLMENYPYELIVVGGEADRFMAERWILQWKFGEFKSLPIPELVSFLERSRLIIGADSGVIHLANLLRKDNIALFGNSDYRGKWTHPEHPKQTVLYPTKHCIDCLGHRNKPCFCMNYLSVDAVFNAIASYSCMSFSQS